MNETGNVLSPGIAIPGILIERTDQAPCRAKSTGRNIVCLEPSAMPTVSAEEKHMLFALSPTQEPK